MWFGVAVNTKGGSYTGLSCFLGVCAVFCVFRGCVFVLLVRVYEVGLSFLVFRMYSYYFVRGRLYGGSLPARVFLAFCVVLELIRGVLGLFIFGRLEARCGPLG